MAIQALTSFRNWSLFERKTKWLAFGMTITFALGSPALKPLIAAVV